MVRTLKPYKAPRPDGIPNIILMKCIDVIIDHLFYIYRASLEFAFYYDYWLTSLTLVLRKPGKPAYDVAKTYRPIGLLDTIGKLLSTLVATDLSFLVETHGMLPPGQFGGRPGRNTTDAMHMVTSKIKDVWQAGKVATALFLDVQGAFHNTVKTQLIHNMRARGVPLNYTNLIESMLTNRKTHLKFDDYTSPPLSIDNGTTQGCPLSMILYVFYNAPLVDTARHKNETTIGFVDDCLYLAIADSLSEAHSAVKDMMERQDSGFTWSISHNSPFELSKLALMNFPRSHHDAAPPDLILSCTNTDGTTTNQSIDTVPTFKYLGIIFDSQLCWSTHHHKVTANAIWWSLQIARLSRISGGMPPHHLRQLYTPSQSQPSPMLLMYGLLMFTDPPAAPSASAR